LGLTFIRDHTKASKSWRVIREKY